MNVPAKLFVGTRILLDLTFDGGGIREYIEGNTFKNLVPIIKCFCGNFNVLYIGGMGA